MVEEQIVRTIADKQSSMEVSKNAKGDIQYAIKLYFNTEEWEKTLKQLKEIETEVKKNFEKKGE